MRLIVRNPLTLSPTSGQATSQTSGQITGEYLDPSTGEIFAREPDASVADEPSRWASSCAGTTRVVLRSGSFAPAGDDALDAPAWLASWSEKGWAVFDEQVRDATRAAGQLGVELLIRPHAQGMLSDAVSTLSWCTRGGGQHQSLLLDPIGWLVPSMIRDVEDHLVRLGELSAAMISHGRVAGVLLRSFRRDPGTDRLLPASLGDGQLDAGLIIGHLGPLIEQAPAAVVLDERDWTLLA